jgi:hypothetical protein
MRSNRRMQLTGDSGFARLCRQVMRGARPLRSNLTRMSSLAILWPECRTRSSWPPRRPGPTGPCRPIDGLKCGTPSTDTCGTSLPG